MNMGEPQAKAIPNPALANKDNSATAMKEDVPDTAQSVSEVDPLADTKPQPIVLEEVDRLRLENVQLKLMNANARMSELDRAADGLQKEYMKMLGELSKKYGFDPGTTELEPGTGRVVPRGTIPR
jgi:hypothetical protein